MTVRPKPDGYADVTACLIVDGAADAIAFCEQALCAKEQMRMPMGEGRTGHAELQIDVSVVMLADEFPDMDIRGPCSRGVTIASFLVCVPDVHAEHPKARDAGAQVIRPLADPSYGDRSVTFEDPFGHQRTLATHVADVDEEERMRPFAPTSQDGDDATSSGPPRRGDGRRWTDPWGGFGVDPSGPSIHAARRAGGRRVAA